MLRMSKVSASVVDPPVFDRVVVFIFTLPEPGPPINHTSLARDVPNAWY